MLAGLHILDRFHIVAKMNDALDDVRAGESLYMYRDDYEPVLKKSRWLLLKRKKNLTGKQRFPAARRAPLQPENRPRLPSQGSLSSSFGITSRRHGPQKFLDEWCRQTMRSRIEPMKKIALSLHQTS